MERETAAANSAYDYENCRKIWRRVDPTLRPYPEARAVMAEEGSGEELTAAERRAELALPGAQADPCCMGTEAMESIDVLQGFVRAELSDRREYLFLARRVPTAEARRVFHALAVEEERHARKLSAALYLITGERSAPTLCGTQLRYEGYCAALRGRYHEEVCGGFNYRRAAEETLDLCLQRLLLEFSQDEYRHAQRLLNLLAGTM